MKGRIPSGNKSKSHSCNHDSKHTKVPEVHTKGIYFPVLNNSCFYCISTGKFGRKPVKTAGGIAAITNRTCQDEYQDL